MTDAHQDVRARLSRLARRPRRPDGGSTAERVLAVNRARRLRAGRWAAAVAAVVVLGATAPLARPVDPVVQAAPATSRPGPPPPALYELPARGSLADEPEFLAAVAELPWSPPPSGSGFSRPFDPDTRRVVYAADVPGGHRWAVVMAGHGPQWVLNWFTGPRGAEPGELTEATPPTVFSPSEPLALMDVSADTGPLVLLGEPGATAEYSATLDRAPDGSLVRDFLSLREVAGVPAALVRTPLTSDPATSARLYLRRDGVDVQVQQVLTTGTPPWVRTDQEPRPLDPAAVEACLAAIGFTVQAAPPRDGFYYEDPRTGDLSSVEQAARDRASEECFRTGTRD